MQRPIKRKSKERIEMESKDLIAISLHLSTEQIGKAFGFSSNTVQEVLTDQFSKKRIGFSSEMLQKKVDICNSNEPSWEELKQTQMYKELLTKKK